MDVEQDVFSEFYNTNSCNQSREVFAFAKIFERPVIPSHFVVRACCFWILTNDGGCDVM